MNLWDSYLHLYASLPNRCEKPWGLISEPVDAFSNIAFFISAYFIYKLFTKHNIQDKRLRFLMVLIPIIGLGSTTYHAFHSAYSALFDLLPIYIFVFYSLYLFTSFLTKSTALRILIPVTLFIIQIGFRFIEMPLFILGMPTFHLFNIIFIIGLAFWGYSRIGGAIKGVFPIIIFYFFGISVRYFDLIVCPINGVGTHFIWHICVAFAAYFTALFFAKLLTRRQDLN